MTVRIVRAARRDRDVVRRATLPVRVLLVLGASGDRRRRGVCQIGVRVLVCPRANEGAQETAVEGGRVQLVDSDLLEDIRDVIDDGDRLLLVIQERLELGANELRRRSVMSALRTSESAGKRTLSRESTAYEPITKCESGAYLRNPSGPISSRRSNAQLTADEWHRAKKWPMSTADRSSAFCSPNALIVSIA